MLPPERKDTTNVRPDDYSRKPGDARKNFTVRTDYSVSKEQRKHDSASASKALFKPRETDKVTPHYTTPTQAVKPAANTSAGPWSNADRSQANISNLERTLNATISEKAKDFTGRQSAVTTALSAVFDFLTTTDKSSTTREERLRTCVYKQVDALVRIGMDREIALQRMLDKVNNGSIFIMFEDVAVARRTLKWVAIGILVLVFIL